jgi:hypothetical protein
MPTWTWYDNVKRYRDERGRFASPKNIWSFSDASIDAHDTQLAQMASRLADQSLSLDGWQRQMREIIHQEATTQYLLGRGGKAALTQADMDAIGRITVEQYSYLDDFAQGIASGRYSEKQIANISGMYINSTREAYEVANAAAHGIPELPAYPGDGDTPCLTSCKCHWYIIEKKNGWECTWTLGAADHCSGCLEHSDEWAPLFIPYPEGRAA